MFRPIRDGLGVVVLLALAALALAVPALAAPEEKDGRINFAVRLEPVDLAPGGEGVLVVTSILEYEYHVYADDAEAVTWRTIPVDGVTYHVPKADSMTWEDFEKTPGRLTWTQPMLKPLAGFPEAPPDAVWEEGYDFEIRIPVTLAPSVVSDAGIGIVVDYSACDEMNCFDRILGHEVVVRLGKSPLAPEAAGGVRRLVQGPAPESDAAHVTLEIRDREDDDGSVAVITFHPSEGYHLYLPGSPEGLPIEVEPLEDEGITWGDWDYEQTDESFEEPFEVHVPFVRDGARRLRIRVLWQGCNDMGCDDPQSAIIAVRWVAEGEEIPGPVAPPPSTVDPGGEGAPGPAPVEIPAGKKVLVEPIETVPFPVVHGDDLDQPRRDDDWTVVDADAVTVAKPGSDLEEKWASSWILFLGTVFLFGIGLAFTPCVLPIIPLTISVIGGGNPDLKKSRLTVLLVVYVAGLSLTYGAAGAVSGMLGEAIDLEAAFQNPLALWIIAGIFFVLAAGMMGFFELQPPAWMERMRGGAQTRSGTLVGSFLLGILAAVIASPCTGPFVVGMLAFVATMQDPLLGFLLFGTLGLGMGAVFFAAGSLNLLARPGPWMVWVRYAFGVILFGVALYLLANAGQFDVDEAGYTDDVIVLFAVGFAVALVAWWAVARHLHRKEGEKIDVARMRGAILSISLVIATGAVAFLTRPASAGSEGWVKLTSVAHLQEEVARATEEGRPVVVDVWATYCTHCKEYDVVVADDPYLAKAFAEMVRLKIDETDGNRVDLRRAVGLPDGAKPRMAFFDEKGRIRRAADIAGWYGGNSGAELQKRVDFLFWRTVAESAPGDD